MAAFDYRQGQEIRDVLARHSVRYLFIGKAGAILLGFPDTTQDADLFVERSSDNCHALVLALCELGFNLTDAQKHDIESGKEIKIDGEVVKIEIEKLEKEMRKYSLRKPCVLDALVLGVKIK